MTFMGWSNINIDLGALAFQNVISNTSSLHALYRTCYRCLFLPQQILNSKFTSFCGNFGLWFECRICVHNVIFNTTSLHALNIKTVIGKNAWYFKKDQADMSFLVAVKPFITTHIFIHATAVSI